MKKKRREFVVPTIIRRIAPKFDVRVVSEPEWGEAIQITFKNGRKRYFRSSENDINPRGATAVARDKGYARYFMHKMKYPVPRGQTFFREKFRTAIGSDRDERAACAFAQKIGFPVIVKPNSAHQGNGVFMAENESEVLKTLKHIFKEHDIALVEKFIRGRDYRVVVLENKVVAAYERIHLSVVGDGASSIETLLTKKLHSMQKAGRMIALDPHDSRIRHTLSQQRLILRSVPATDRVVLLLPNANLSSGGDMRDCTDTIHVEFKKMAINLTRDMGLRFSGVDIISQYDISEKPQKYAIIEINSAPGLTHFSSLGERQRVRSENIYYSILKLLEKMC